MNSKRMQLAKAMAQLNAMGQMLPWNGHLPIMLDKNGKHNGSIKCKKVLMDK
jgi:hypothetical protein